MAWENPSWGYDHLQRVLANVGHKVSDTIVGNILEARGVEPHRIGSANRMGRLFQSHWEVLAAIDFTTLEVWTKGGLTTADNRNINQTVLLRDTKAPLTCSKRLTRSKSPV